MILLSWMVFCDPFRKDSTAHSGGLLIYVSDKLVAVRKPDIESQSVSSIWVEIKYIEDIYFFEVNTKYISSNVLKISEISRVRSTSEIADIFNT